MHNLYHIDIYLTFITKLKLLEWNTTHSFDCEYIYTVAYNVWLDVETMGAFGITFCFGTFM